MKVRLLPGGALALAALGITLRAGDIAHLPRRVIERHAGRLEVLEPTVEPPEPVDVMTFHTSGGWYEVPGHPQKVRKAEAELLLASRA